MKKVLSTLAISGLTLAAFGQGTVNWSGVANLLIAETNGATYSSFVPSSGNGTGGVGVTAGNASTTYYYELLVSSSSSTAPTTVAGLANWKDTGLEAENGAAANGRILQLNSGTAVTANNWAAGATENLILVGWSANLGTTWAAALSDLQNWSTDGSSVVGAAYFGVGSSVGLLASNPGNPGVSVFGTGAGQINNAAANPLVMNQLFNGTAPVPEPGTMALAGLGGLSLLAFRRKK